MKYSDLSAKSKATLKRNALAWEQTPKGRFNRYRIGAVKRELPFNLTMEEFMQFWQLPCEYCGVDIPTIGLDRINSDLGYSVDNVRACCTMCNLMKRNLDCEVFLEHCQRVARFKS